MVERKTKRLFSSKWNFNWIDFASEKEFASFCICSSKHFPFWFRSEIAFACFRQIDFHFWTNQFLFSRCLCLHAKIRKGNFSSHFCLLALRCQFRVLLKSFYASFAFSWLFLVLFISFLLSLTVASNYCGQFLMNLSTSFTFNTHKAHTLAVNDRERVDAERKWNSLNDKWAHRCLTFSNVLFSLLLLALLCHFEKPKSQDWMVHTIDFSLTSIIAKSTTTLHQIVCVASISLSFFRHFQSSYFASSSSWLCRSHSHLNIRCHSFPFISFIFLFLLSFLWCAMCRWNARAHI